MPNLDDFELATMPGLWRWYEQSARQLAFRASSRDEAEAWQRTLRDTLTRLLGRRPDMTGPLDAQRIEIVETDGFTRELVVIQTQPGEYMPCYVLIPHQAAPPYKPVIALHGHGTWGARGLVGIAESDLETEFIKQLNYDYARQFALRGYLVFAPVLRGFAERMEATTPINPDSPAPVDPKWLSSCRQVALNAILCGTTLISLRVWDVIRLVDYIQSRPEPMIRGLGCVGLSGGGTATLFTTALEPRITCAVVSGYVNTFRTSIMSIEHCPCNYIPGILQYAEIPDIAALIAPRPLLVESGDHDPIYPVEGTRQALDVLRAAYGCFGADDHLDADIFEGVHQWSGKKAYDWIAKWL
jgi:dienelactone hydrolase